MRFCRGRRPTDRTTRVFFGDAAGAAIVPALDPNLGVGILSTVIDTQLDLAVGIRSGGSAEPTTTKTVANGGHFIHMDGRKVWTLATEKLPSAIRAATAEAGLDIADVDNFVFHQANLNIIHAAMDELGVDKEKAPITLDRLGNTGSASIFTALAELYGTGKLNRDRTTVIATIGAGFIWGAMVIRH